MIVAGAHLRDFRSYADERVTLAPGLTVIHGANGAGKTNLLEALYFGATARSCRTNNEREVVRFGAGTTRVELSTVAADGFAHEWRSASSRARRSGSQSTGGRSSAWPSTLHGR